ncbi:MAG: hypothetical protein JJ975_16430 [Bacteroidia bacterium]|nr:hypothetical protein [Bacteroidia bacterium]
MTRTNIHIFSFLLVLVHSVSSSSAQIDILETANAKVDGNQSRIDGYDGERDNKVVLLSELQTTEATTLYLNTVDQIQKNINNNFNYSELDKKRRLTDLVNMLERVDRNSYHMYTAYSTYFNLIIKVQEILENKRIKAILKSDLLTAIHVIPFYDDKPYAEEILKLTAQSYPSELLKRYKDFAFQPYASSVLEELCKYAPAHVSFYMGGNNPVFLALGQTKGQPTVDKMMEIFRKVGSNSKAYILLDDITNYRMTATEAHQLGRNRESLFGHLLKLRTSPKILGGYSVDDELTYMATRKVREINELHEERDEVRFALCDTGNMSAQELYTLMVYGEDEVYTSSFLGLFNRLIDRIEEESSYEFLHNLGRNKYRTFIKMCASYNVLPAFLAKMSIWEKRSLFNSFVGGLEKEINPLEQAVAVADTYGSLTDNDNKSLFENALKKEYQNVRWSNAEAEKLYGLLLSLLRINPESQDLQEDLSGLATIANTSLLKDGQHVQQHFFFDDEDGWASYATFVSRFQRSGWKIVDKGYFVLIESTSGKKVKIYANKARKEYDGQDALKAYFKESKRYPDVVVHRGHSYYANITIESITPNSDLVVLGSCGGYNNISKVLDYSPNAQIISSKQVGTMWVNNELIFSICEYIRTGRDLTWEALWKDVGKQIGPNKVAQERFADYLPPHKNLGAILIRTYRRTL